MKIEFKKITIQNLLSFGNSPTEIEFKNGLHLITGQNGVGKSSALLDALSFVLYGMPYRKIVKSDLINRKNRKGLKVSCEFVIGDKLYRIDRGLKHKDCDLELYIDGISQKMLSTKRLSQEEIDSIIGIDYKTFKQVISLSINYNKPFFTLSSQEKRELIEKFFSLDLIADMMKVSKEKLRSLKIQKSSLSDTIAVTKNFLEQEKHRIISIEKSQKEFSDSIHDEILSIDKNINEHIILQKDAKTCAIELKKEYDLIVIPPQNSKELSKQLEDIRNNIYSKKGSVKNSEQMIHWLNTTDICPTCKMEVDSEHKSLEIEQISNDMSKILLEIEELIKLESDIKHQISEYDRIRDIAISKRDDIKIRLHTHKSTYESESEIIKTLTNNKSQLEKKTFVIDVSEMKKECRKNLKILKSHNEELSAINDKIEVYTDIVDMCSETGLKSYLFSQITPFMSKVVNEYIANFNLPISIQFDNEMQETITTSYNKKQTISYNAFSEGEKKRIDMAILFSFIEITKKIANWNCNVLIIDELLDSSIDDDGLKKLIISLNDISKSGMGVFIISHRLKKEFTEIFTNIYRVYQDPNSFSKIEIL